MDKQASREITNKIIAMFAAENVLDIKNEAVRKIKRQPFFGKSAVYGPEDTITIRRPQQYMSMGD